LQELADFAKDLGVTIAIENTSPESEEETLWELSKQFSQSKIFPSNALSPQVPKQFFCRKLENTNMGRRLKN